jgi:hypothetical protein
MILYRDQNNNQGVTGLGILMIFSARLELFWFYREDRNQFYFSCTEVLFEPSFETRYNYHGHSASLPYSFRTEL